LSLVSPALSRTLTVVAAAVLAFDGAALAALGWWGSRPWLALIGVVFFLSSGLVLLYWRWYRRRLEDIAAARRELGEEARAMQRLLGKR
jgi:membrane protein implicated in regulation of membrane protease activity